MKVRKRAESRTPAIPITRRLREARGAHGHVAHHVERVGDDDEDRVGAAVAACLTTAADDRRVLRQQVVAAHAGLAGEAAT